MRLRSPELKTEKMFNQQIFRKREELIDIIWGLSEEESCEVNQLEGKKRKCSLIKKLIFKVRI